MRWMAAVPLLLLLPGCTTDPTYGISGSFAADRSEDDLGDLETAAEEHGGSVLILESSPEQYVISGMEQGDCEELHAILVEKEYLASVGACAPDEESTAYN